MTLPPRNLELKRPAQVIRQAPLRRPVPIRDKRLIGSRQAVLAQRDKLIRSGDLVNRSPIRLETIGVNAGKFVMDVQVIDRPPAPRWIKPTIIAGSVLAGSSALVGLVLWVLSSLSPVALGVFLGAVGGLFALWVWSKHGPRSGISVTTITQVTIR